MKKKLFHWIFRWLSLTSNMFVFQACFGAPQDFENDIYLTGVVTSSKTGEPVKRIKVLLGKTCQYQFTDSLGRFNMYVPEQGDYNLRIAGVDPINNGYFITRDTSLVNANDAIHVDITL